MARKKIIIIDSRENPTNEVTLDLKEVENMAAYGFTQEQIAIIKGITPETFSRQKSKSKKLKQAIERGKLIDRKNIFLAIRSLGFGMPAKYDKENNQLWPARLPSFGPLKYLANVIHKINEKTGVDITSGGEPIQKVPIDKFVKLVNDVDTNE